LWLTHSSPPEHPHLGEGAGKREPLDYARDKRVQNVDL
jgi:hypothetical protein